MRTLREMLSPPQTAGFTNLNFIGFDFSDFIIGLIIYSVIAAAIVVWASELIVIAFALVSAFVVGSIVAIIWLIYLEHNLPEGKWVLMPWLGGWDRDGTIGDK